MIKLSHLKVSTHYIQKKAQGLISNLLDVKTTKFFKNQYLSRTAFAMRYSVF